VIHPNISLSISGDKAHVVRKADATPLNGAVLDAGSLPWICPKLSALHYPHRDRFVVTTVSSLGSGSYD
jgi:hypothetical protein